MGAYANGWLTDGAAFIATIAIVAMNLVLILQAFGVDIPFLPSV